MSVHEWGQRVADVMEEIDAALAEHDRLSGAFDDDEATEALREASYYLEKARDFLDTSGSYLFYRELRRSRLAWKPGVPEDDGLYYVRRRSPNWAGNPAKQIYEIDTISCRNRRWLSDREMTLKLAEMGAEWCPVENVSEEETR